MRRPPRSATLAFLCLVLCACTTHAPATDGESAPGQALPSAAARSTAPTPTAPSTTATTDGTTANVDPYPEEQPLTAQEYWAEEALVREAAIEYLDLGFAVTPIEELVPEGLTCAPATWYVDVASGDLSYDEYSLRATYALFNDEERLGPLAEEVCEGEGLGLVEAMGMGPMVFWDAVSPQTKVAMWDHYLGGGGPIESAGTLADVEYYHAMTAELRAYEGLD